MMAALRQHLAAAGTPLRRVLPAAEFAALTAPPPVGAMPCAYVVPLGTASSENLVVNQVRQRVQETFGVILCVSSAADAVGGGAAEGVEAVRDAVRAALIGWQPTPAWEPVVLGAGQLLDMIESTVWWQDSYSTAHLLQKF